MGTGSVHEKARAGRVPTPVQASRVTIQHMTLPYFTTAEHKRAIKRLNVRTTVGVGHRFKPGAFFADHIPTRSPMEK